jgi:hypothetical protein
MSESVIECSVLDKVMQKTCGDKARLEISVARRLQQNGYVRIIDPRLTVQEKEYDEKFYLVKEKFETGKALHKIAWVQDYSMIGGAELSNFQVIKIGTNCGFDIVGVTPQNFNERILQECDLIILNNFFEFRTEQYNTILKYLFENKKPYIKYEHDHRELNRINTAKRIFSGARICIFISPLHKENHCRALEISSINTICLPLAINTEKFCRDEKIQKEDTIFIPAFNKCQVNALQFINQNRDKKFIIVGHSDLVTIKHEKFISLDYSKMPLFYNRVKTVYHCPLKREGGSRIYFEAALCGCDLVVNENVLHASWGFDIKNSANLKNALDRAIFDFWQVIELSISKTR